MDEKVRQKQKIYDEEERLFIETRKLEEENRRKKIEEGAFVSQKKRRRSPIKNKKKIYIEENISLKMPLGIQEIYTKFHGLVGENKLKIPVKMNGNCQGISKAILLFQDPEKGPDLSANKNRY